MSTGVDKRPTSRTFAMFTEFERPLTDEERARLLASLPRRQTFLQEWGSILVGSLLGVPFAWLYADWRDGPRAAWVFASICGLIWVLVLAYAGWDTWHKRGEPARRTRELMRQLAGATVVRVQRIEARTVVEIGTDSDSFYLFDLEDSRYYQAEWCEARGRPHREKWPNSQFELLTIPGSNEEFGPFCFGQKLEPSQYLDFREIDLDKLSGENRIFRGSLDSLLAREQTPAPD
jgi:hypothetical protein